MMAVFQHEMAVLHNTPPFPSLAWQSAAYTGIQNRESGFCFAWANIGTEGTAAKRQGNIFLIRIAGISLSDAALF
jgi:hypothetical protein